jgi:hypothetical protein
LLAKSYYPAPVKFARNGKPPVKKLPICKQENNPNFALPPFIPSVPIIYRRFFRNFVEIFPKSSYESPPWEAIAL